jgi:hypothetical protein
MWIKLISRPLLHDEDQNDSDKRSSPDPSDPERRWRDLEHVARGRSQTQALEFASVVQVASKTRTKLGRSSKIPSGVT